MQYYALTSLTNGILGLFLVYYVFLRNKNSALNRSFAYIGGSIATWCVFYAFWSLATNATQAVMFTRMHMFFVAFIPSAFLHFALRFTNKYHKHRPVLICCYVISYIFAPIMLLTPLVVAGSRHVLNFEYWPVGGILLIPYVSFFAIVVIYTFAILIQFFLQSSGTIKQQALWLIVGFAFGFGGGSTNWFLWFDIPVQPVAHFFVGICFVIIAYAVVKHGLMDVDIVVDIVRSSRLSTMGLISASINHEIRNPLFVIKNMAANYAELPEGLKPQKAAEYLSQIARQSDRALEIMQRFSMIMKRPGKTKTETCNLYDAFKNALFLVSHEVEKKNIEIELKVDQALTVQADAAHMEEIFLNLLVNACHAVSDTQSPKITVSAEKSNRKVLITFSDNGSGMTKSEAEKIFEPFYTTKASGTGLGLYVVKLLAERNGGKIDIAERYRSRGTAFKLEFPALGIS